MTDDDVFVKLVLQNKWNRTVLERAPALALPDWWLTAGAVFQTVWNVLDGRDPTAGINDYDLFYFDATDLSWEAEDRVIRKAEELFEDLDVRVEVRNEALGTPLVPRTVRHVRGALHEHTRRDRPLCLDHVLLRHHP